MEAELETHDNAFEGILHLEGHGRVTLGKWHNKNQAVRAYSKKIEKTRNGEYTLHAYSDGSLEIEFL